ncbi:hypothetical protein D1007_54293 [Hordeum vulgare]|nr:hypothetical protein D1007_54293 [Hordeum vulgare]
MDMRLLDLTSGMLWQGENKEIAASRSRGRKGVKGDLRPIMMARLMQTGRPPLPARRNWEVGDLMLGMACVLGEGTMPLRLGGGKTCRLPSPAKEVSVSEESKEDDELLIESMQLDHEEYLNESSKWIVPVPLERGNNTPEIQNDVKKVQVTFSSVVRKSLSYADVVTNNWQVLELEGEADPNIKISNDYVVLSPETDNNVDVIPTPPIASEADTRFSKRNACGMQEKVEDRARRLASKKDLEGNPKLRNNSFGVLSDAELISRASNTGVIIPDGSFACTDVLRELEQVREELDIKKNTSHENQEHDIFITDGLGHSTPISLEWLDQDEAIFESKSITKSKRNNNRKPIVRISRPVTRSEKKKEQNDGGKCLQQEDDAGELRSGVELVRTNTMQLMKLCKAVRHGIAGG